MDLTNSAAEGWRIRSRKSCHVSGAVDEPKTSAFSIRTTETAKTMGFRRESSRIRSDREEEKMGFIERDREFVEDGIDVIQVKVSKSPTG